MGRLPFWHPPHVFLNNLVHPFLISSAQIINHGRIVRYYNRFPCSTDSQYAGYLHCDQADRGKGRIGHRPYRSDRGDSDLHLGLLDPWERLTGSTRSRLRMVAGAKGSLQDRLAQGPADRNRRMDIGRDSWIHPSDTNGAILRTACERRNPHPIKEARPGPWPSIAEPHRLHLGNRVDSMLSADGGHLLTLGSWNNSPPQVRTHEQEGKDRTKTIPQ